MYIESAEIANYKSFRASGCLTFGPGFNIIASQNDVGKTALLEALSLSFSAQPHKSIKTMPRPGSRVAPTSQVDIAFALAAGEAKYLLMDGADTFTVPMIPTQNSPAVPGQDISEAGLKFIASLDKPDRLSTMWKNNGLDYSYLESVGDIKFNNSISFTVNHTSDQIEPNNYATASTSNYAQVLADVIRSRIYMFKAQRYNNTFSSFAKNSRLVNDASNLAQVLNNLQSNKHRFERYNEYVKRIFSHIGWVGAPAAEGTSVQILIWPKGQVDTEREELGIPLADSGTGVGQVLAILYVVLMADRPQIIIIDEPQSFLNPGAVRKLMEVLKVRCAPEVGQLPMLNLARERREE